MNSQKQMNESFFEQQQREEKGANNFAMRHAMPWHAMTWQLIRPKKRIESMHRMVPYCTVMEEEKKKKKWLYILYTIYYIVYSIYYLYINISKNDQHTQSII
jgi:hypothetical protein